MRAAFAGALAALFFPLGAEAAGSMNVLVLHSFGRDFAPYDTIASVFRTELARGSTEPIKGQQAATHRVASEGNRFLGDELLTRQTTTNSWEDRVEWRLSGKLYGATHRLRVAGRCQMGSLTIWRYPTLSGLLRSKKAGRRGLWRTAPRGQLCRTNRR